MKKNEKFLALLLSVVMILTCFVGTVTVSAEDATTPTATIVIKADDVEAGAKQIPVTFTVTSTLGINEALIKVSSNLGDIIAQPTVVVDEGIGTAIADPAVENPTDYNSFFLSAVSPDGQAETVMGEITKATISAVFTNEAGLVAGETYTVDVEIPEGKVIAASKDEVAIKLECTKYEFTVEEAPEEDVILDADDLKMRGAGITMANGFALDFKVRKTNETSLGYSDMYIVFDKPRYDAEGNVVENRIVTVYAEDRITDPTNAENFVYTLEGVQPQELGTEVSATIYGYKGKQLYKGATVKYSVLKFATNQLKSLKESSNPTPLQIACADMIFFGAAVQDYAKYNTANPIIDAANIACESEIWKKAATEEITRELVKGQTNAALNGATVRIRSAGVTLSSKVILYFNCADLGVTTLANKENYVVRVTYKNVKDEDRTFDLEINDSYQAELDTLYSTELGTIVTATMIDKATDTAVSNTVTYSIETFLKSKLTDANMGAWCTALAKYGDSVRAYAGLN